MLQRRCAFRGVEDWTDLRRQHVFDLFGRGREVVPKHFTHMHLPDRLSQPGRLPYVVGYARALVGTKIGVSMVGVLRPAPARPSRSLILVRTTIPCRLLCGHAIHDLRSPTFGLGFEDSIQERDDVLFQESITYGKALINR